MPRYEVGFDGRWQDTFDDLNEAVTWAREVAETGRTVDVIRRRRLVGSRTFITAFPESEYAARKAAWSVPWIDGGGGVYGV